MTKEFKNWFESKGCFTNFFVWYYCLKNPNLPYGEKLYFIYKGKLTAFKFVESALARFDSSMYKAPQWYIHLLVAGVGDVFMKLTDFDSAYGYFRSIDDYNAFLDGLIINKKSVEYESTNTEETIKREFGLRNVKTENSWNHGMVVYHAGRGELNASETVLEITEYSINGDGTKITTDWYGRWGDSKIKVYATPIEAIKANAVSEVVDFDDEPKKPNFGKLYCAIEDMVDDWGGVYTFNKPHIFTMQEDGKAINVSVVAIARLAEGCEGGCRLVAMDKDFSHWDLDDYFSVAEIEELYKLIVD